MLLQLLVDGGAAPAGGCASKPRHRLAPRLPISALSSASPASSRSGRISSRKADAPMRVKSCSSARRGSPNAPQVEQQRLEQQQQQAQLSCPPAGMS